MLIGEVAATVGVTVKAVRFYADQGLLGHVPKAGTYRTFKSHHVQRLRLISHCRSLGFSVAEIRDVIALLPEHGCPPAAAMLALVDAKLADLAKESERLKRKIRRLTERRRYLADRTETEASDGA
jgi:DNA-binding transcriptional MerR regulator